MTRGPGSGGADRAMAKSWGMISFLWEFYSVNRTVWCCRTECQEALALVTGTPSPGSLCLPSRSSLPRVLWHIQSVRVTATRQAQGHLSVASESTSQHGPGRGQLCFLQSTKLGGGGSLNCCRCLNNTRKHDKISRTQGIAGRSSRNVVYIGRPWVPWPGTSLYNWNAFCFSFLSSPLGFFSFFFFFCMFLLEMDKMCSSPHDCGCFGERFWSMMYSRCNSEHCAVRQMFRLLL